MKEFHRNYVYRPTDTEKKGRRVKNLCKEPCKCFAPFVKLHYYDCPIVKKSCPVHGHIHYHESREEKEQPEQNMIISFHPSSKTERLFQPVKTLLAQCNPETKVNLQYYSPKSTSSKESIRHQQVQTQPTDKNSVDNNVFVEKTKSFIADKTNKMKKLKQCFYSPCNSITHKSRSQTSIKDKFYEEKKKVSDLDKMAPDKPPDDIKLDPNIWSSSKMSLKNWEKISAGKRDSDFITVTQQAKNNLINHKIFEIKHKKGLNDVPYTRMGKSGTQLVYSSLDLDRRMTETEDYQGRGQRKEMYEKEMPPVEPFERKQKGDEELSSDGYSRTSSSSSVYFTPFIFVPAGTEITRNDKPKPVDEAVQVDDIGDGNWDPLARATQTSSLFSEQELVTHSNGFNTTSVLLQTDFSGDSTGNQWYLRHVDVAESFTTRGTQTDDGMFPSLNSLSEKKGVSPPSSKELTASWTETDDPRPNDKQTMASPNDKQIMASPKDQQPMANPNDKQTMTSPTESVALQTVETTGVRTVEVVKTVEMQTNTVRWENIRRTTRWAISRIDKICQTEPLRPGQEVSKLWSFTSSKPQVATPKQSSKLTQTDSQPETADESINVTMVNPLDQQESDQAIDKLAKAWWGKSHSDSEVYMSKKCECLKSDSPFVQPHDCFCKPSAATREPTTPTEQYRKEPVSSSSPPNESDTSTTKNKVDKAEGTENGVLRMFRRGEDSRASTPGKVDKSLGTSDGGERFYKRADKALGTDSGMNIFHPTPRETVIVETSTKETVVISAPKKEITFAATPTDSTRTMESPNITQPTSKEVQTVGREEDSHTPLSDLSELTRIIQDFFEKTGMSSFRNCSCDIPAERKSEPVKPPVEPKKPKNENEESGTGSQHPPQGKTNTATVTDQPKKPKGEHNMEIQTLSTAKTPPASDNRPTCTQGSSDRVKIRRSVLLDDIQTKTRFICSVCAREISTFSTNAATNTENVTSPRKKDKPSISAEVSEMVKVKTIRTVQSYETPNRQQSGSVSTRAQRSDPNDGKSLHEPQRNCMPTPRAGPSCNVSRETQNPSKSVSVKPTATITFQKFPPPKKCFCNDMDKICSLNTCPKKGNSPMAPSTSRAPPPRSDHSGGQSRPPVDKSRTLRRNPEHYYPVIIPKSLWPREFSWNRSEKSQSSDTGESKSCTMQKRSHEKETEPVDIPAGKKIKAEYERASGQSFVFGDAKFTNSHPLSKGFVWIPSLSTSHVTPSKKHTPGHSKIIKSEEKVREGSQREVPPEGFNMEGSLDPCSAKSCHLTPIPLGCDHKQPFDKLFECRVCKSLTFIKADLNEVFFHWPDGVFAYRPETPEDENFSHQQDKSLRPVESSSANLEKLLEECSRFSLSESHSTEGVEEEEATEEDPEVKFQDHNGPPALDDLFYSSAAVSSNSFNAFRFDGTSKKE